MRNFYLTIFLCLICFCTSFGNDDNIEGYLDSIRALPKLKQIELSYNKAWMLSGTDVDGALSLTNYALKLSTDIDDSLWMVKLRIDLANYYAKAFMYDEAYHNLAVATSIAQQANLKYWEAVCYNELGIWYMKLFAYDASLEYFYKSLQLKKDFGSKKSVATTYNNIGLIFYKIDNNEKALEFYNKVLSLKMEMGDTSKSIPTFINLGLVNIKLNDYYSAINAFQKAIVLSEKFSTSEFYESAYNGLGKVYLELDEFENAKYYLDRAFEYSVQSGNVDLLSQGNYLLGKLEYKKKNFEAAKKYVRKSNELALGIGNKELLSKNYELQSQIYESSGNADSAYYYLKRYTQLEDSLFNESQAKNVANLQLAIQAEESQRVIEHQEKIISKNRELNYLLAIIIVLSVILAIFIYKNYVNTKNINQRLSEAKNELERQKQELMLKNEKLEEADRTIKEQNQKLKVYNTKLEVAVKERTRELEQSNRNLEKAVHDLDLFIYKTSHDLRGPLASIEGLFNLAALENEYDNIHIYFKKAVDIVSDMNHVLFQLIEVHDYYQRTPELEVIYLTKEIEKILLEIDKDAEFENVKIITELNSDVDWVSDKYFLRFIFISMFKNAFNYAVRKNCFVKLSTEIRDENLIVFFEDNGHGISDNQKDNVFNIFFKGAPKPIATGLELYSVKMAVEKLFGSIELVKLRENTVYKITFPKQMMRVDKL